MPTDRQIQSLSKRRLIAGIAASVTGGSFLAFDGIIKVVRIQPVIESFAQMGYPEHLALVVGVVELACLSLYAVPRTSVLGAVLLTGFLGGAISAKMRVGDPLFSHVLFPVYVAAFIWGGLYLREGRLAGILPLRRGQEA